MSRRADRVAAVGVGIGVGLIAFMLTWILGSRATERLWGQPTAAIAAMATAVLVGIVISAVAGRVLLRSTGRMSGQRAR